MRKNTISTDRTRKWRAANRDTHNRYMREYRNRSVGVMLDDPDEIWFENDPRKRKAVQQATPPWVDGVAIRDIYNKCEALNRKYAGTGFTVHHEIPITHPTVCGLHIPENMKIVSASIKKRLGRKFRN